MPAQPFPDAHWDPIPPEEVAALLAGAPFFWCLAGGYAVERFVGQAYRGHGDTDIVVYRHDQVAAQRALAGWELWAADPPGTLRPWRAGERLPVGVHDIWGFREGRQAWELQLMLQEEEGEDWVYRRDPRVRGPKDGFAEDVDGLPCIRIEIQLLYKSKGLREKDVLDFERSLPRLGGARRARLRALLGAAYPEGHPWIDRLDAAPG